MTAETGWRIVVVTMAPAFARMMDDLARELDHRVIAVLTSQGPKRRRNANHIPLAEWVRPSVDLIVSNFPQRWAAMLEPLKPDLIVCMGFPWKIPVDVLAVPRLGAINAHPSALPRYRGPGSMVGSWYFLNDEREVTVTVHRMDGEIDTGPIMAQKVIPLDENDDLMGLVDRVMSVVPDTFREAFLAIARGEQGRPQDAEGGFYVEWLTDDQRYIDWSQPARTVHNLVRAWHGHDIPHGALGQLNGSSAVVTRTRLVHGDAPSAGTPGEIIEACDDGTLLIQCGDGPLEILEWSEVGDSSLQEEGV